MELKLTMVFQFDFSLQQDLGVGPKKNCEKRKRSLGENMSEMKPVKPFRYEFCQGCMLNGCYPWSINPFLKCSTIGGLCPVAIVVTRSAKVCPSCKPVTESVWFAHLKDMRKQAKEYEMTRLEAMRSGVMSNQKELW